MLICVGLLYCYPSSAQDTNQVGGNLNFVNVPANQVLDDYQRLTHRTLLVASNVRLENKHITFHFEGSMDSAPPSLEQALLKQAGIMITRLDDKRDTVIIPNDTNNVTYELFKHDAISGAPFMAYALKGADAEVIQAQLLAITNASGHQICGSISEADATRINFYFFKTNGVPYRVHLEVK
jgi:hypothetical protein